MNSIANSPVPSPSKKWLQWNRYACVDFIYSSRRFMMMVLHLHVYCLKAWNCVSDNRKMARPLVNFSNISPWKTLFLLLEKSLWELINLSLTLSVVCSIKLLNLPCWNCHYIYSDFEMLIPVFQGIRCGVYVYGDWNGGRLSDRVPRTSLIGVPV